MIEFLCRMVPGVEGHGIEIAAYVEKFRRCRGIELIDVIEMGPIEKGSLKDGCRMDNNENKSPTDSNNRKSKPLEHVPF